ERDALAHEQFARLYAEPDEAPAIRLIDPATVPGAAAQAIATLTANGISTLLLQDLTHDLGVPVFRATITDRSFPGREGTAMRFEGLGADLDPAVALARAVHEAAQSHAGFLVGGRDEFEDG